VAHNLSTYGSIQLINTDPLDDIQEATAKEITQTINQIHWAFHSSQTVSECMPKAMCSKAIKVLLQPLVQSIRRMRGVALSISNISWE
jgi:hypothetical protein